MDHSRAVRISLLLIFLISFSGCGADGPESPGSEEVLELRKGEDGRLVIIGGALQSGNTSVYQAVLDGRWGAGPLCVLPTASGTPTSSMDGYVAAFNALGGTGTAQGILLTVDNGYKAGSEEMAARLKRCSGFFFTGGSQSRIMEVFLPDGEPTPAFAALWERFKAGAVVSGSSAGAAIMTDPMIAGGSSPGALAEGIRTAAGGGVWLREGMGFLKDGVVDQHFLARGRWARLLVGVLGSDTDSLGFGIDENTALVVEGDSAWVAGESGVVFLDARVAFRKPGEFGGSGVRFHLLGRGDVVDLLTGAVRREPTKTLLPQAGAPFGSPNADLFAPWTLLHVLSELGSAPDSRLTFRQEGHFLEFRKEPSFEARAWDGLGPQGTPLGLSLGPFVLSVWRE
jgi:cyanophycinase